MPRSLVSLLKTVAVCASLSLLIACSSEELNPPSELESFIATVKLQRLWKTSVGDGDDDLKLSLRPVVAGDKIYTIDVDGLLSALDVDSGKLLWERELEERVSGGLAVDQLAIYYTTFQGQLVSIDRESGNPRWRRTLVSEAISPPASNGRSVVVQSIDGRLTAFDASEGLQRWRYDSAGSILSLRGTPSPLINDNAVITSFSNGEMLAFQLSTGSVLWKAVVGHPQGRTELERLVDPDGQPVSDEGRVYAIAYQGNMVCLDARTGTEIWSKPLSSFNGLSVGIKHAYASLEDGSIVAVNKSNSNEIWRNEKLKYRRLTSPVLFDGFLAVSDFEGYLHLLDTATGEFAARVRPDSDGVMGDVLISGERMFVYTRSGDLLAYQLVQ